MQMYERLEDLTRYKTYLHALPKKQETKRWLEISLEIDTRAPSCTRTSLNSKFKLPHPGATIQEQISRVGM